MVGILARVSLVVIALSTAVQCSSSTTNDSESNDAGGSGGIKSGGGGAGGSGGTAGDAAVNGGTSGTGGASGSGGAAGAVDSGTDAGECGGACTAAAPICENGKCTQCPMSACNILGDCSGGSCVCYPGLSACATGCVDFASDSSNCGACGNKCLDGEYCHNQMCECRNGLTNCSGSCIDLKADPASCGTAGLCVGGTQCPATESCNAGQCVTTCPTPKVACAVPGGKGCFDLNWHPAHCGGCNIACKSDELCLGKACLKKVPATPCTTCPCKEVCDFLLGTNSTCCQMNGVATCVVGSFCPPTPT